MHNYQLNLQLMTNAELMREYESVQSLTDHTRFNQHTKWWRLLQQASKEMQSRGIKSIN